MIVEMNKLTVICLAADRDKALNALGRLGVLHLAHVRAPEGADLDALAAERVRTERARALLQAAEPATESDASSAVAGEVPAERDPARLVALALETAQEVRRLENRLEAVQTERAAVEPFGQFEPDAVDRLAARGILVKFGYRAGREPLAAPDGVVLRVMREDKNGRYFVLIGKGDFESVGRTLEAPARSLAAIDKDIEALSAALRTGRRRLARLAAHVDRLAAHLAALDGRIAYAEARAGMGDKGRLAWLRGFCPVDTVDSVRHAAKAKGWGLLVEEPGDEEPVPTLIRSPKWVRPVKAVFDMIGVLPGYGEVDISAVFLLFFSVFFAILIGDAGYGVLFLGLTAATRLKFRKAPSEPFVLLTILSVCTIVWGVMTGAYFGIENLPAPLRGIQVTWLKDQANMTSLCFLIGAIHLSVGHAWNAIRVINSTKAIAQVGWICLCWTMYFAARTMVLDMAFPGWVWWLFGDGLVGVVLFMTSPREFKTEWTGHVMLPLTVIGNFVDVVSYLRLFAVGTASLAVAMAFNDMAVGQGINSVVAGLIAAFILFFGHTLNILLGAMGILVHGVRLNTLEFSGHMGIQWAGFKYAPFVREAKED